MRDMVWATAAAIWAAVLVLSSVPAARPLTVPAAAQRDAPAAHRAPGESIPTYDVVLAIRPDGVLHVRETITYDFRGRGEHGIVRRVPYRINNRLYDIRNVRTSSSTGAPARARAIRLLHETHIRVGGGDRTVSGRQAYVIEYDVVGAMTPLPGRVELRWDAIGSGWDVPIGEVSVRVEAPVRPLRVSCRAGATGLAGGSSDGVGLTRCGWDRDGLYAVDFTQGGLRPHESVLIKVRLPEGSVYAPPPRYARPHFTASWPGYLALAAGLALAFTPLLPPAARLSRRFPRRPGKRTLVGLVAAGTAAVTFDVADDMVAHGFWAASIGDPFLAGLGLLAPAVAIIMSVRRTGGPEQEATGDQRA